LIGERTIIMRAHAVAEDGEVPEASCGGCLRWVASRLGLLGFRNSLLVTLSIGHESSQTFDTPWCG